MAINPHDDYEALAKLLYPSIEASGNVYYGQTRKLTMDEVLKKNDLGFESHIESAKLADNTHEIYFCWKLGPLSDRIKVNNVDYCIVDSNTFCDTDLVLPSTISDDDKLNYFAKYNITHNSSSINNQLSSGSYITYEKDISIERQFIVAKLGSPISNSSDNLGNFYIDGDNLYILVIKSVPYFSIPEDDQADYITFSPKTIATVKLDKAFQNERIPSATYSISYDGNTWESYILGSVIPLSREPTIHTHSQVKFRCDSFDHSFGGYGNLNYYRFTVQGDVAVGGNLASMNTIENGLYPRGAFWGLFKNCSDITVNNVIFPHSHLNGYSFYETFYGCSGITSHKPIKLDFISNCELENTFKNCTSLRSSTLIAPFVYASDAFDETYSGCTSLTSANIEIINAKYYWGQPFRKMFYGCTSLSEVTFLYKDISLFKSAVNTQPTANSILYVNPFAQPVLIDGWDIRKADIAGFNINYEDASNYVLAVGSDSIYNDYYTSATVNSYNNSNGSLSQEIWGYKSFNSPVEFKNKLYTSDLTYIEPVSIDHYEIEFWEGQFGNDVSQDVGNSSRWVCNVSNEAIELVDNDIPQSTIGQYSAISEFSDISNMRCAVSQTYVYSSVSTEFVSGDNQLDWVHGAQNSASVRTNAYTVATWDDYEDQYSKHYRYVTAMSSGMNAVVGTFTEYSDDDGYDIVDSYATLGYHEWYDLNNGIIAGKDNVLIKAEDAIIFDGNITDNVKVNAVTTSKIYPKNKNKFIEVDYINNSNLAIKCLKKLVLDENRITSALVSSVIDRECNIILTNDTSNHWLHNTTINNVVLKLKVSFDKARSIIDDSEYAIPDMQAQCLSYSIREFNSTIGDVENKFDKIYCNTIYGIPGCSTSGIRSSYSPYNIQAHVGNITMLLIEGAGLNIDSILTGSEFTYKLVNSNSQFTGNLKYNNGSSTSVILPGSVGTDTKVYEAIFKPSTGMFEHGTEIAPSKWFVISSSKVESNKAVVLAVCSESDYIIKY